MVGSKYPGLNRFHYPYHVVQNFREWRTQFPTLRPRQAIHRCCSPYANGVEYGFRYLSGIRRLTLDAASTAVVGKTIRTVMEGKLIYFFARSHISSQL